MMEGYRVKEYMCEKDGIRGGCFKQQGERDGSFSAVGTPLGDVSRASEASALLIDR